MPLLLNLQFPSITCDHRVPRLHRFVQAPRLARARARARARAVPCPCRAVLVLMPAPVIDRPIVPAR